MYLTSVHTDGDDMYHSHTVVKSLFPGESRALFINNFGRMRVLSASRPSVSMAYDGSEVVEVREVSPPETGKSITLKVLFNPTRRVRVARGRSHCVGIIDPEEAKVWLECVLHSSGAKPLTLAVDTRGVLKLAKGGTWHASLAVHQAIALVTVEDGEKFRQALLSGIGGGKFAGCGLIDIW